MDYNEFNFLLEQLKTNLYQKLEQSKLPLGAIFYLIKDIYNNLNNQYITSINSYSFDHPAEEGTVIVSDSENENLKEQN